MGNGPLIQAAEKSRYALPGEDVIFDAYSSRYGVDKKE